MLSHPWWAWALFLVFVIGMLILDLGVFHKKNHVIKFKEALVWSAFWMALALIFSGGLFYLEGTQPATEFLTAYILEKSLSVDNLFVFLVIFSYFKVPDQSRHKVLFWGIIGALFARAFFITVGVSLLNYFHWVMYVFGAILLYTAYKLAVQGEDEEMDPSKNGVLNFLKKYLPFKSEFNGDNFFVKDGRKTYGTPLLACLVVVEMSDLMFAVDSIPAVIAISKDPFIIFTSNIFAILGLRSLYFALEGLMPMFIYLKKALVIILAFIGIKMLIADFYHISTMYSLAVVVGTLTLSVLLSLVSLRNNRR